MQAPQNPTPPSGILPWILERPLQIPDISPLYGTIGGSPPPPGGALGRRSLLCLGRSDAPVNDMLGIAQQHRGGWRSVPLPSCHLGPGPRARKWGECRDTASRGTLGVCSAYNFRNPGSTIPTPPLILLGDLKARSRRQLKGGRDGRPFQSPSSSSLPFLPKRSNTPVLLKDSGVREPPFRGTETSRGFRTSPNVSPGPRCLSPPFQELRHPSPFSFCPVNLASKF